MISVVCFAKTRNACTFWSAMRVVNDRDNFKSDADSREWLYLSVGVYRTACHIAAIFDSDGLGIDHF